MHLSIPINEGALIATVWQISEGEPEINLRYESSDTKDVGSIVHLSTDSLLHMNWFLSRCKHTDSLEMYGK